MGEAAPKGVLEIKHRCLAYRACDYLSFQDTNAPSVLMSFRLSMRGA